MCSKWNRRRTQTARWRSSDPPARTLGARAPPAPADMDAMILAAGLGTRLGEITRDIPKALVDVAGTPIIERVAHRLIAAGADRLIINVHHHAQRIIDFVHSRDDFDVAVEFSHEPDGPLETGGEIRRASCRENVRK